MSGDPFDFFERFFNEIFNLSQRITEPNAFHSRSAPDAHFEREGREIIPLDDRWILIEELGNNVKEADTSVNLVEKDDKRFITVENPIVQVNRRYKLAKNMTGKFTWSVRNGYFQLDLYINNEGKNNGEANS